MIEFHKISATQIAQLIKSGETTSRNVVAYFIAKIEEVNPNLNAVVIKLFDEALTLADEADASILRGEKVGKLHGVPFTIKECLDLIGTPSTFGLLRRKHDYPTSTDPYVSALQKEGAIVIGKTNVSQLLATIESRNPVYGTTNNPHSLTHSSGGSSGGEGAIIAAGGSPAGLGTDIGGSIRIPASFNGICAIKPTTLRTIDQARFLEDPIDLPIPSVTGILANHAKDLQLFLQIMNNVNGPSKTELKDLKEVNYSKLKIGYFLSDEIFEPSAAIKRGIHESLDILANLGVETTLFTPPNPIEAEEIYTKIMSANKMPLFANNLKEDKAIPLLQSYFFLVNCPQFIRDAIYYLSKVTGQSTVKRVVRYFGGTNKKSLERLKISLKEYRKKYLAAMDHSPIGKLDAIICPAFPTPAILHKTANKMGLGGTYTIQGNLTGFPSGIATVTNEKKTDSLSRKSSLDLVMRTAAKIDKESEGLPIGIQIIGRPWEDHIVIGLIDKLHKHDQNKVQFHTNKL